MASSFYKGDPTFAQLNIGVYTKKGLQLYDKALLLFVKCNVLTVSFVV